MKVVNNTVCGRYAERNQKNIQVKLIRSFGVNE
jgi:hypothetical protein